MMIRILLTPLYSGFRVLLVCVCLLVLAPVPRATAQLPSVTASERPELQTPNVT
jgi:hypothetical protein